MFIGFKITFALTDIEKELKKYNKIVLSAPPGFGKSIIAAALADKYKSSFIVTTTKLLQDQYADFFKDLKSVKGKSNFVCLKQMEQHKPDSIIDHGIALDMKMTCDTGECREQITENGKIKYQDCKFKPRIDESESKSSTDVCYYYKQKFDGLRNNHSVWNYYSYFQVLTHDHNPYLNYLNREITIFDEAHNLESNIREFAKIDISTTQLQECGITLCNYVNYDMNDICNILYNMKQYYSTQIKNFDNSHESQNNFVDNIISIEKTIDKIKHNNAFFSDQHQSFVLNTNTQESYVSFIPQDISIYAHKFFHKKHQIFISSFLDFDLFCESLKIPKNMIKFINVSDLQFRSTNYVKFFDVAPFVHNRPDIISKFSRCVDEILDKHHDERGLILASSRSLCNEILDELSVRNKARVRLCHTSNNPSNQTPDEIIREHTITSHGVLLSSSLWDGIDLKDDISRFQIILSLPYTPHSDPTGMIHKGDSSWRDTQTASKLLRGLGRSIRNDQDWADTYILDSNIHKLLSDARDTIPKSYYDIFNIKDDKVSYLRKLFQHMFRR